MADFNLGSTMRPAAGTGDKPLVLTYSKKQIDDKDIGSLTLDAVTNILTINTKDNTAPLTVDLTIFKADLRVGSASHVDGVITLTLTDSTTTVDINVKDLLKSVGGGTIKGDGTTTTPLEVELSTDDKNVLSVGTDGGLFGQEVITTLVQEAIDGSILYTSEDGTETRVHIPVDIILLDNISESDGMDLTDGQMLYTKSADIFDTIPKYSVWLFEIGATDGDYVTQNGALHKQNDGISFFTQPENEVGKEISFNLDSKTNNNGTKAPSSNLVYFRRHHTNTNEVTTDIGVNIAGTDKGWHIARKTSHSTYEYLGALEGAIPMITRAETIETIQANDTFNTVLTIGATVPITLSKPVPGATRAVVWVVDGQGRSSRVDMDLASGAVNALASSYDTWHIGLFDYNSGLGTFSIISRGVLQTLKRVVIYGETIQTTVIRPEDLEIVGGTGTDKQILLANGDGTVEFADIDLTAFLKIVDANATFRKITDSYSRTEIVDKIKTDALTYWEIAYTGYGDRSILASDVKYVVGSDGKSYEALVDKVVAGTDPVTDTGVNWKLVTTPPVVPNKIVSHNGFVEVVSNEDETVTATINGKEVLKVDKGGDVHITIKGRGIILKSDDGTAYRVSVTNNGSLYTEAV